MSIGGQEFLRQLVTCSYALNVLTCAAIIPLVLSKNRTRVAESFSLFISTLGLWSLLYAIWAQQRDPVMSEFWVRTVMIPVTFMPATFLHFVSDITERPLRRELHVLNYAISLAFTSSVYSPAFAPYGGPSFLFFRVWPLAGPLLYLEVAHFAVTFGYGWLVLFQIVRHGQEPLKTGLRPVFWGTLIGIIAGCMNFLPWFKIYIPPIFPPCIVIVVVAFAYAIIRHQLMDIEVVVKRTLVFAGLVGSVAVIVSLVAFVSQDVVARVVKIPKIWSNLLSAMIIAAAYGRTHRWLVDVTDRYLFQKKYDYKELLRKFTNEAMGIVDLKQLVQRTVATLTETIKLDRCQLLLLNKQTRQYELIGAYGGAAPSVTLDEHEPFITFLRRTQEPIGTEGELGRVRFPETVRQRLRELEARLCLPLHLHDELIGVLALGKKKSDEPFSKDDLDILLSLSRTLSIAVSNARLFDDLAKTQAEAAQREKLAVIGTLSAGINHEIRNPLGIARAQCETFVLDWQDGLLRAQPWEAILHRCLAIMQSAIYHIDRATAITRKLSSFAKPIRELSVQHVSVAHEIDEVLALLGHDLELEKIEVKKEIERELPDIIADRGQVEEILFNLIRNAGQAIEPPGTIWIRAYARGDAHVRIEIADTGCGIPPDKLEKIFDPFFTTKEPGKGTGLGLFIVRQVIERNKGRISVESTVERGTTFFLDFPKAPPRDAATMKRATDPVVRSEYAS